MRHKRSSRRPRRPDELLEAARLSLRKRQTGRFNISHQREWAQRAEDAVDLWLEVDGRQNTGSGQALRIADLGAGNERLREILASRLQTEHQYYPYDLHPQSPSTQALDVRAGLPNDWFDLIFCLGLLEYVPLDDGFLQGLGRHCRYVVVSYVVTDSSLPLTPREREAAGWLSHFSSKELTALLDRNNFHTLAASRTDGDRTGLWLAESLHSAKL